MDKLHLIQKDGEYFVYIPSSYDIVKVNKLTYNVVLQLISGQAKSDICKIYNIERSDIEKMEAYFRNLSVNHSSPSRTHCLKSNERVIDRITVHVSNDCNLRCKYCYASGGNYQSPKKLMSEDTAEAFVDFCIREFSEVRNIVFFGGEPLLNPSEILHICQLFEYNYKVGKIRVLPKFGAITNGTIMSPLIMEIIKTHFSFITVSIDGPKSINDFNRVDKNGNGCFSRISKFIKNVRNISNLDIQYEATYTESHLKMGYTRENIHKFMHETFHIAGNVLDEYNMEKNSILDERSYYSAEDIVNHKYPEGFWSIIQTLVTKHPKTMCQLYWQNLSVSVDGDIYPCHMNVGTKNCCLGNIKSHNAYAVPQDFLSNHPGIAEGFKNNKICNDCWARNLCGGCSRLWFYDEYCQNYSSLPNRSICERNNKHLENILISIYNLKANPSKWKSFFSEHLCKKNQN